MRVINPQSWPIKTNEWDCTDVETVTSVFAGMCKGLIFKSVPNQEQFFMIRIIEEGGQTQQWRMEPMYQGQRMVFDVPRYIEIDSVIKIPLLVSWRTQIIVMDGIITEINAHDPAEMIWWPGVRDHVVPGAEVWSDPIYYYPLRSGHLRWRSKNNCTGPLLRVSSECESTGVAYLVTETLGQGCPSGSEVFPTEMTYLDRCSVLAYVTQGLRYKLEFKQEDIEDKVMDMDIASIHGGFAI